jgi:hypothetical protein
VGELVEAGCSPNGAARRLDGPMSLRHNRTLALDGGAEGGRGRASQMCCGGYGCSVDDRVDNGRVGCGHLMTQIARQPRAHGPPLRSSVMKLRSRVEVVAVLVGGGEDGGTRGGKPPDKIG